jgi:hypothetical protein
MSSSCLFAYIDCYATTTAATIDNTQVDKQHKLKYIPPHTLANAELLLSALYNNPQPQQDFLAQLAVLHCVPVTAPYSDSAGSGNSSGPRPKKLVKFCDAAAPADADLCFAVMPVHAEATMLPKITWSRLKIVSPPAEATVMAHLQAITTGELRFVYHNFHYMLEKVVSDHNYLCDVCMDNTSLRSVLS